MIDIHSHILPMVDDGAEDMNMSIEMARLYLENGINKVIATPHYIDGSRATNLDINKRTLEELRRELVREGLDLEIFLGNEAYISLDLIKDIDEGRLATLNGTRYILIELPMHDIPLYVESVIFELLVKGFIPIIAHPERNVKIMEDPNILYNYITKGALTQLNLPSIEGRYGNGVKDTAEVLLRNHMIHFVGTDAHTNRMRSPNVKEALDILKSLINKEEFLKITYENPKLLLENKIIEIKDPIKYKVDRSKLRFLSRLKNKISNIIY